uniref:Uncharacterized protein n=1 Tax=Nelumbo nucifera TaxID=4432 RepID=A0A822YZX0_NELNU|nr:TPA_asm: hypothetical protein HUJ06_008913 [Nelumbo nucifera]
MSLSRFFQEIRVQFKLQRSRNFGRRLPLLQLWSPAGICTDFGKEGAGVLLPSSSVKA